ncbi:hypothetical protein Zmor_017381 [Zophobas morio]|uniref:Protein hunchback n=1 Tax=Zophobas morio TaxID=2755281 RepID=A0AA38I8R2_9CUCU|nr:hypothetical protein Zmor_017381 [Zophobas morio]
MANHVRRRCFRLETFTCDNAKIEAYYCKDCDFKTQLTILFKQHGLKRESRKDISDPDFLIQNYVCKQCDFETNLSLKWLQHTSVCTKTKQNLQSVSSLKESATHSSDFKQTDEIHWYYCPECPYKGKLKRNLKRHIQGCHLPKRYGCDKCSFKCTRKENLKHHINLHLNNEDAKWYKCNQCSFQTKHPGFIKSHVIFKHLDDSDANIKWYQCQNCSYRTKQANHLGRHLIYTHLNDEEIERYKCGDCSFKGKIKDDLTRHVKRHLKIK